jgi:hypothetical protein
MRKEKRRETDAALVEGEQAGHYWWIERRGRRGRRRAREASRLGQRSDQAGRASSRVACSRAAWRWHNTRARASVGTAARGTRTMRRWPEVGGLTCGARTVARRWRESGAAGEADGCARCAAHGSRADRAVLLYYVYVGTGTWTRVQISFQPMKIHLNVTFIIIFQSSYFIIIK